MEGGRKNTAQKTEAAKGRTQEGHTLWRIQHTSDVLPTRPTSTPLTGETLNPEGVKRKEGVNQGPWKSRLGTSVAESVCVYRGYIFWVSSSTSTVRIPHGPS